MKGKEVIFSSKTVHWKTPIDIYDQLNKEFYFTFDPCPLYDKSNNAFFKDWIGRIYCNPPYDNKAIRLFLEKGLLEIKKGNAEVIVYLLPVKTSKKWFHDLVWNHSEIRFFNKRLKFDGAKNPAPFDNMLVIFRSKNHINTEMIKNEI